MAGRLKEYFFMTACCFFCCDEDWEFAKSMTCPLMPNIVGIME